MATNPQMILGVSESANAIPAGDGVLTSISFSNYGGGDICFGSVPELNIISDEFGYELYSIWGDCACPAGLDECEVCGGDGIPDGACDCDGNELDNCGVCDGNN